MEIKTGRNYEANPTPATSLMSARKANWTFEELRTFAEISFLPCWALWVPSPVWRQWGWDLHWTERWGTARPELCRCWVETASAEDCQPAEEEDKTKKKQRVKLLHTKDQYTKISRRFILDRKDVKEEFLSWRLKQTRTTSYHHRPHLSTESVDLKTSLQNPDFDILLNSSNTGGELSY